MNPKRQKMKDRRRARKLADEAWQAVEADNLDLAEKIIRRAVAAQPDNPVLWNDQGMILGLRSNEAESAEAFRAAISMAPTYAEAFANLAALRIRQGFVREAIAMQEQAVKHTPENSLYAERLEAYRSLVAQTKTTEVQPTTDVAESPIEWSQSDSSTRLAALPWPNLADRLTRDGCVLIPGLVDASTCERLRGMFDDDVLFARTVVMDRPEFGLGTYRYFKAPLPLVVDHLRRAMFPYVARIANEWQKLLCEPDRFPDSWEAFRQECAQSGQTTPTPLLLKYEAGGFNALHRDLRGGVFFPIQMAVVLSAHAETGPVPLHAFRGGEFLLCDVPEGKKAKRREIHAGLGDAILFCTRDRLVCVGGAYGLQPVKHGVAPITAGERFVLGVPFHEYR
jgi:hypothetical protein